MAMPPEIAPLAEVVQYLGIGSSISNADRSLLQTLKSRIENEIRRYLGHNVTQPTSEYVHFLPDRSVITDTAELVDVTTTKKITFRESFDDGDVLQLPQIFVRSITEVREDFDAYAGQGSSSFNSDTILTAGTDYYLDVDESGLSKSGHLIRIGTSWPSAARTVRVIYNAGFTATELDTTYSDIKEAVIDETVSRFKLAKSRAGADSAGVGPIKAESLGGQYSVQYDTSRLSASGLSEATKSTLQRYLNIRL